MANFANPSMFSASPDIGGVGAEYNSNTAQQYDESLSQELEETKTALETEKIQNISQVVYNSVNNEKLTESDYQFSKEDVYDNTDFSDKTDTYVNMNTSYRYIKFNVDGAGEAYNQLGDGCDFKKDSPKKVFANLKNRFVELGFNKKFENGSRKTVNMNSDKDFLYVIGLFQAVVEDKVDSASKKDFRVGPNTLKSLAGNIKFEVKNTDNDIAETKNALNETKNDIIKENILDERSLEEKISELDSGVLKYSNDIFDLPEASYGDLKKDIENKLIELSVLQEAVKGNENMDQFDKIGKLIDSYNRLLNIAVGLEKYNEKHGTKNVDFIKNSVFSLSHKYLGELFKLDNNVEKSEFKQQWEQLELAFPKLNSDKERDGFYNSIYYGLYDLRNKFTNSKVKKEITSLMEEYDPLFDKYENFYNVGDKVVDRLFDEGIFKRDLSLIEDFFNNEGSRENADSSSRENTVSWSLLTEDGEDGTAGQRTRLISAMKKLINEGKISEQELTDFKAVMFQTRDVFSNVLDELKIKSTDASLDKNNESMIEKDSLLGIEAQRGFEQPILDNVKKIRQEMIEINKNKDVVGNDSNDKLASLDADYKEFDRNKKLFEGELENKYFKLEKDFNAIMKSDDIDSLNGLVAKISNYEKEMEAIVSEYDSKISKSADHMMVVALSGQQMAYKNYLPKYNILLSAANKQLSNLTIKKAAQAEIKKEKIVNSNVEKLDKIDLSKELLSEKDLSDVEIKEIIESLNTPKYLDRRGKKYNLNKLEDVSSVIESGINTTAFRNIRDNLVYIEGLKK